MLPRRIASRYAEALFGLAQEKDTIAQWDGELAQVATLLADTPDLLAVLTHPEVPLSRKLDVVERILGAAVSREIVTLLGLLLKRHHDPDLALVHALYQERWNTLRRIVPVHVVSALPLSVGQTQSLTQSLMRRTGASVQLTQAVDPEILAGLVITIGDRMLDASARSTLETLRATLAG
jgi:F-type H+-transporting ATPase subunit delta